MSRACVLSDLEMQVTRSPVKEKDFPLEDFSSKVETFFHSSVDVKRASLTCVSVNNPFSRLYVLLLRKRRRRI